ncbi:MAG TPA: zinc ABC transporter substrate-binding protein, partial [Spirochaetota bacterium]|nr:zinc ABC transporter substrate-binding protein [Spirochaetota bacterium]
MKNIIFLSVLASVFMLSGCGKSEDNRSGKINIFTSILPQKYFVERIGGDRVSVSVLVGPGKSPATYEPLPDQVIALGTADIFFTIGVPFENVFIPKIQKSLKSLKIVDTSEGIKKRTIGNHDHDEHREEESDHGAGVPDPHVWMSARLVKQQALNIYNALTEKDPEGKDFYKKGYDGFIADLD